jgi:hypothetical protein
LSTEKRSKENLTKMQRKNFKPTLNSTVRQPLKEIFFSFVFPLKSFCSCANEKLKVKHNSHVRFKAQKAIMKKGKQKPMT